MARQAGGRNSGDTGNSKIRFIMLEADLSSGDLAQITQAISNALRPVAGPQTRLIAPASSAPVVNGTAPVTEAGDVTALDAEAPIEVVNDSATPPSRPQRRRSYRTPTIIDDLDLTGNGTSFVEFATQKSPKKDVKRFLTVMAWFKNHGGRSAIGIDEVYTAYRKKGDWPYGIEDYDGVFRGLVRRDLAKRTATGTYAINQIGEAEIDIDTE